MNAIDLAIVGTGLSGARVFVEIARSLRESQHLARPLRIVLFDKQSEFGRGVPYGSLSDRSCLLIETVSGTRCPEFTHWLRNRPDSLRDLRNSNRTCDREWYRRNATAIEHHCFDELFVPRHVFGRFSAEELQLHIDALTSSQTIFIERRCTEIAEITRSAAGSYLLASVQGERFIARAVVLAVGSIPRGDQYWPALQTRHRHCYIKDDEYCGSFDLERRLMEFIAVAPSRPLHVAIVGGGASAIESLHTILTHRSLIGRIALITTISRSGVLPGDVRASDCEDHNISPWALQRTSARDYVDAARHAQQRKLLIVRSGMVEGIASGSGDQMEIRFSNSSGIHVVMADLIVNCSGAGDLLTTPSPLLQSLAKQQPLRGDARGFRMQDSYTLEQWPNFYLAGPLLNGHGLDSHVESISAAFRVSRELGPRVADVLCSNCEAAA